ncbi:MAG: response regulator [Proteobacteria bacterium]|nr:response regulator [Pseudomonadota bacterium]
MSEDSGKRPGALARRPLREGGLERELARALRYRLYLDHVLIPVTTLDVDGTILHINRAGADHLRGDPENFVGRSVYDVLPDIAATTRPRLARALAGHIASYETSIQLPGGARWFESSYRPIRDESGQVIAVQILSQEITAKVRAERALEKSQIQLKNAEAQAAIGTWEFDLSAGKNQWSEEMYRLYGRDPSLGPPTLDEFALLVHPDDRDHVLRSQQFALRSRSGGVVEFRTNPAKGPVRHLKTTFGISDQEGESVMIKGTLMDVTAMRRADDEKKRLEEQLRHAQKLDSLGVLAGGIAHDFNNILVGIMCNAEFALARTEKLDVVHRAIEDVLIASRRAADLCQQMLSYSGLGKFTVGVLDLSDVARELGHLIKASISKRAQLRHELASDLPVIEADAAQIQQIILNLLTNASDALADKDGVITMRTGVERCSREDLSRTYLNDDLPAGDYVFLEVSDTGSGIDPATLGRIFDPFFTSKGAGRGLGLAAVLGIIRGHRGAIDVVSQLGAGTTIKVFLPAAQARANPTEPYRSAELRRPDAGVTVLLVDDEALVRRAAERTLTREGYSVLSAADGRKAIELFRQHSQRIDVVLLDLTMPHLDGRQTLAELRRERADIKVILMSGYGDIDTGSGVLAVDCFIQKPFMPDELLRAVADTLSD